ncbi:acyl-CoA:6-aminopenicillanic acid acyl transferase [Aliiruegeria haliotis]|uniref:Acyl-CoA:6-aminopenicillanic acid acyl transferase n=1 Tax=Aliiruegeria haliotis TaxID=1280846 RepID=A0A2T0RGG1_9RHOB|nr:C45 family peptidase [Aliiruegeria haliotis]PRY20222.1 acyl-CoA:6-aminopenicillanic acid acyl transferase [Aliiruegeria haliotis]
MAKNELTIVGESGAGKLYEKNGFLVPVLTGTSLEMGEQYGAMMVEYMQKAYDTLVQPWRDKGIITDEDMQVWTERSYATFSARNRLFYDGVAKGSGWPLEKIGILDNIMEFGVYESKMLSSFAGCTSIFAWGDYTADGKMYSGRNQDWAEAYLDFPQVMTIRKPTDGSYKYATMGWPGIYFTLTAMNEHGAYLDIHDATAMAGSIVYMDRQPITSILSDVVSECKSVKAMIHRFNTIMPSTSLILSLADENGAASIELSGPAGGRVRAPDGESFVTVNSFLNEDWGIGIRDTATHSLVRGTNMQARMSEHEGKIDASVTRDVMDIKLYAADGSLLPNGGCTKPINQDDDVTVYQVVSNVNDREVWLKVPVPHHFADWTHFDLKALWD